VDRLLGALVSRAARRGWGGEPLWLAVAAAAWMVRRTLKSREPVAWSGRLQPGERLVIAVAGSGAPDRAADGGE
jgi:hypothetical protein